MYLVACRKKFNSDRAVVPFAAAVSTTQGSVSDVKSLPMPRWGKKTSGTPPAPVSFVLIKITSHPGKYAMRGVKGALLVAPKAQASEFPSTEAPRRQKELERRGFKTKVEPA